MKTEKTPELIEHMLAELETPCRELTKWEQDFIESISEQFNTQQSLSDRQFELLEGIYTEKTA